VEGEAAEEESLCLKVSEEPERKKQKQKQEEENLGLVHVEGLLGQALAPVKGEKMMLEGCLASDGFVEGGRGGGLVGKAGGGKGGERRPCSAADCLQDMEQAGVPWDPYLGVILLGC